MAMNDSAFVFYESFLKSIQNVERFRGKEEAFDFAMSIMEYGCYGLPPEDTDPAWLYGFEQVRAAIDAAQDRRQKQIAQGKMGGRPRKIANIEEILAMRANGLSIRAIAEQLNISDKTVRRRLQEHEDMKNPEAPQDKTSSTSFVPCNPMKSVEKSQSVSGSDLSAPTPSKTQLFSGTSNGTKPPCEVLTAQWDITGQRSFVPYHSDKNSTDLSEVSKYNCKSHDGWDKTGQKDKTGQNLKEKEKEKVKEKDKYFLGGYAACPTNRSKTTVEWDKTGTKPPDNFCPTMGQNLCNDFCPDELDKTQRQNWDKNGQNLLEEFCPSMGQNPCHDFCPNEWDKTLLTKMGQNGTKPSHEFCPSEMEKTTVAKVDKNGQNPTVMFCPTNGQNPTIVNRDKNGQNPTTEFCPPIISREEAEELVATSRENLYISGNKVLCEDDERQWIIL